jgi:hypothetical protein
LSASEAAREGWLANRSREAADLPAFALRAAAGNLRECLSASEAAREGWLANPSREAADLPALRRATFAAARNLSVSEGVREDWLG